MVVFITTTVFASASNAAPNSPSLSDTSLTHAQADAINNTFGNSYISAKNSQTVTKGQMAKAGKQAQVAANNAMAAGLHIAAAQSYKKNDPTGHPAPVASQSTSVSKAMSVANVAGASSTAAPGANNTMDQGIKKNPAGHPVNITSQAPDMAALTASKMASVSNPVGTAPATMLAETKNNPTGNVINQAAKDMNPRTPVTVTDKSGKTKHTTAGAIAKETPNAQIGVNYASVFNANQPKNGNRHDKAHSSNEGHNGRGSENAHSHAFGGHGYGHDNSRSEGFGGHSHFH
jgi:hypothetical protein